MQNGEGNKVLDIIGNFHIERDSSFLEALGKDVEDTSFDKGTSLATMLHRLLSNLPSL